MTGLSKVVIALVLPLFVINGVMSRDLLKDGILNDGTCLIIGNFITNQSLIDNELFQDQVMIQTAAWNILDDLREFTWMMLRMNNRHILMIKDEQYALQGFIEDNFKDVSCVLLIEDSHLNVPTEYKDRVGPVTNLTTVQV